MKLHPHAKLGIYTGILIFALSTWIHDMFGFLMNAIATCAIGWVAVKNCFIQQPVFRTIMFTHVSFSACYAIYLLNTMPEHISASQQHGLYVAAFGALLIGLFKLNKPHEV